MALYVHSFSTIAETDPEFGKGGGGAVHKVCEIMELFQVLDL